MAGILAKGTDVTDPPPTEPYVPRPALSVAPTDQVGDCRLVREIGRGGMGVVYEAVQEPLGRRVAVKLLPAADAADREQFQREAQAAARLHHPNIVPVFAHGEQSGMCYYVMQLIPGVGLDAILAARAAGRPPLTPFDSLPAAEYYRAVAGVGVQVADALAYAHANGVLHRDIKPGNLIRDDRGTVWVTDFGVAKVDDDRRTRTGEVVGTLNYMAPERLAGRSDARCDVYSLGVTLYELLTGRTAFPETTPEKLVKLLLAGLPRPPREVRPDIPTDLETVILKATAPDPAWRYQTAADLADDLRRFLDDRPVLARRTRLPGRAWLWAKREPWLAAAGVTIGSLLVAFASAAAVAYREKANALREMEVHHRSEADLAKLALDGLNRTYARLAPTRLAVALSTDTVPALENLLDTYKQIAEKGDEYRPQLSGRVGEAYLRIGDIHQRLGQYLPATEAYATAAERFVESGDRLRQAEALNQRGRALRKLQQFAFADAAHRKALEVLAAGGDEFRADPRVRFEQAFAHWGLGHPDGNSREPKAAAERQKAIALLESLAKDPTATEFRLLLAECQRHRKPQPATKELRDLAAKHPHIPDYSLSLCEALGALTPRWFIESNAAREARLTEAAELAGKLTVRFPAVPAFVAAQARYTENVGIVRAERGNKTGAEESFRTASEIQQKLVDRYPDVSEYAVRLGMMLLEQGRVVDDPKDRPKARALYRSGIDWVEKVYRSNPDRSPECVPILREAYTEYADLLEADQETVEAEKYRNRERALPNDPVPTPSPR